MRIDANFEAFAESIGVPVVVADTVGCVVTANVHATEMFAGVFGTAPEVFRSGALPETGWHVVDENGVALGRDEEPGHVARRLGAPVRDRVIGFVVGDAPIRWFVQSAVPIRADDEGPRGWHVVSTFVDITARRELEARLEQRATHDPLTQLANRDLFDDRLVQAGTRLEREAGSIALLVLDLDDFKVCNDLYGHHVGDALLVALAERLRTLVRPGDTVARLGGDEFAILVEGADTGRAVALAQEVLTAVRVPIVLDTGLEVRVSVSIGIAVREEVGEPDEIHLAADDACFAAKHAGKGTYHVHDGEFGPRRGVVVATDAEDAHAWAGYVRDLRAEIDVRKREGRMPVAASAPDSVFRVLEQVLVCIDGLEPSGAALLELPRPRDLAPFVFHQSSIELWFDQLRRDGILTARPRVGAERFWSAVRGAVDLADPRASVTREM